MSARQIWLTVAVVALAAVALPGALVVWDGIVVWEWLKDFFIGAAAIGILVLIANWYYDYQVSIVEEGTRRAMRKQEREGER